MIDPRHNHLATFTRNLMMREAIASVSLSHDTDCTCLTCRAAKGDEDAFAEVLARQEELDEERGEGS